MAAVIGKMEAAGGEYTKAVQDLLPASRQAYLAIKRMATLPNRFCVVSSGENNPIEYFSFSSLQKSIQGKTKESIDSCNHDAATAYFSSHGLAVVDEVGYHMETVKFKIGEEDVNRAPDIYGLDRTRSFALTSLLTRENLGEHPFAAYFGLGSSKRGRRIDANVVDEPDLRADLSNWILDRALNGIRFDEANEQGQNSNQMAGLFLDDKEFLSSFYSGFMSGLKTPEAITEDRHAPYKVYRAMGPDQEAKVTTSSWEHFYDSRNNLWYVKNAADNHLGKVIFDHYKKLSELEKALDVDPEKFADFEKSVEFFEDLSDLTVAEFQNTLSETLQGFDALPFSGQLKSSYLGQESPDNLFVYWTSIAGEKYREMRKAGSLSAAPAEAFQEFSAKKLSEVLAEDVIATVSQHYTATFEHALEETLGLADTADGELKIGNSSFAQEAFEAELDAQIGVLYQMMRANHMGGMSYHHF